MRPLSILLLTTALVAPTSACNKGSEPGTMSPPAPGPSDGSTSSAASGQGVETSSLPANGRATLGEGFEGALVMHTTSANGATDMLFITKGGKLRADTPQQGGRTAHTIFDPAAGKLTIIMDSQEIAMQMPIPHSPNANETKPPTITRTGKHETLAGYDCEDWEIVTAGGNHQSTCVAQGLPFFDFAAMGGPTGGHSWAEELRDKNAFPLRAIDFDAKGKEVSRMEVTKVEKRAVDDAAFTVPANFHLMEVPNAAAPGPRPPKTK